MKKWLIIGGVIVFFIAFKAWAFKHPKSSIAMLVGAFLLILEEPAEAQ